MDTSQVVTAVESTPVLQTQFALDEIHPDAPEVRMSLRACATVILGTSLLLWWCIGKVGGLFY
ncbi:hypothetical protein [Muricoccus radiodurans]|uniref:hypothetical protein n=1 Tax=Muricoccus radiodurans TaxID=2231721 RepID=UPI003CE72142